MKKKIATVWPVSSFILEEMEARGWTKEYLLSRKGIRKGLLTGSKLKRRDCTNLAHVFGTSPEYWKNLQELWYIGLQIQLEEEFIGRDK